MNERLAIARARLLAAGERVARVPKAAASILDPAPPIIGRGRDGSPIFAVSGGAGGAAGLQVAQPGLSTVERAPQTTQAPAPGPFSRHSRKASVLAFEKSGMAFGNTITENLKAAGGYLRALNLRITISGLSGGSGLADAPWSIIQSFILKDAFGEPIIQGGGFSLRALATYGGQSGFWNMADPANLPSYAGTAPNYSFRLRIPLELISSDGYCALPLMTSSAVPSVQIVLAAQAAVVSGSTGTAAIAVRCEEEYWVAPVDNPALAPPDVGSSAQWSEAVASQPIASLASQQVELPRKGTFVHTYILILRDSTGARIDAFPDPVEFWIDQTPYFIEPLARRTDEMAETHGVTRPTGVLVYSFRDSTLPTVFGDTADEWLHTTPGTLVELRGTWGTVSNAPARLEVLTGEAFPDSGSPYAAHILE